MIIRIDSGHYDHYDKFPAISFSIETDVAGGELIVNQFSADIVTSNNIPVGAKAALIDHTGNLWTTFYIVESNRIDPYKVRIVAQSAVAILDKYVLPPKYYQDESPDNFISDINIPDVAIWVRDYPSGFTVTGFVPEQTARERLQWLFQAARMYVDSYAYGWSSLAVEAKVVDTTNTLIPKSQTYWRPSISYRRVVTAIKVTAYTFTLGTPQTTDEWVMDGNGDYYIVSKQVYSLANPNAGNAKENVVEVKDNMLINADNVAAILSNLSQYYFNNVELDFECINNTSQYRPGDLVTVYTSENTLVKGFIKTSDFTFGHQAKSKMHLTGIESVVAVEVKIQFFFDGELLDELDEFFPEGYDFNIGENFLDITKTKEDGTIERKVYLANAVSGTATSGGVTIRVDVMLALWYENHTLHIYSVSEINEDAGVIEIS